MSGKRSRGLRPRTLRSRLIYALPRPARDGRTQVRLSPLELIDRLARLVPPPRVHRHRYHGVLAPNAKWRSEATRYGREDVEDAGSDAPDGTTGPSCDHATDRGPRRRWAQVLARVYEVHPLRCPSCHGEMRILAFLTDPRDQASHGNPGSAGRDPFDQSQPGDDGTWSA